MHLAERVARALLRRARRADGTIDPLRLLLPALTLWPLAFLLLAIGALPPEAPAARWVHAHPSLFASLFTIVVIAAVFSTTGALLALWLEHGGRR